MTRYRSDRLTMTEAQFQAGIIDLVITRGGRVIFAEIKTQRGQTTVEQAAWLDALRECGGVETYLWRPADWSAVETALKRKTGKPTDRRPI